MTYSSIELSGVLTSTVFLRLAVGNVVVVVVVGPIDYVTHF